MMEYVFSLLNARNIAITSSAVAIVSGALSLFLILAQRKAVTEADCDTTLANSKEDNIIDAKKYPGGAITVFFGSQTGTAESFATTIKYEGKERGFLIEVVDLEALTENGEDSVMQLLSNPNMLDTDTGKFRCIFLMATYGEGEPTDNAATFLGILKTKIDEGSNESWLNNVEYCVFGLGNTQFEHYNETGKFTDSALQKLGANRIVNLALGNDDDDIESDFENWQEKSLWPVFTAKYILNAAKPEPAIVHNGTSEKSLPDCPYAIKFVDKSTKAISDISSSIIHNSTRYYFTSPTCRIKSSKDLNSLDNVSTLHIEIDIKGKELTYHTADNLGVLPINKSLDVERIAKHLGYDLQQSFTLLSLKNEQHFLSFPVPCEINDLLSKYCDLTSPPRRSDLKKLSQYASNSLDREALLRMSSKSGKEEYQNKIVEPYVGLVEIITNLCPSIQIPLEHFVHICPRLHPRYYTIASSSNVYPNEIHLCMAITKGVNNISNQEYRGVCTGYCEDLKEGDEICIFKRDSTFRLPTDPSKPIIMIGPGTGVAPMRALLQEREFQKQTMNIAIGENVLFFGCKHKNFDYLYQDELEKYHASGLLDSLYMAFSRDQEEKIYVQHLLVEHANEIWKYIENGAYIYVCGGMKMGHDVYQALIAIVEEHSEEKGKDFLENLHKKERFIQELWS